MTGYTMKEFNKAMKNFHFFLEEEFETGKQDVEYMSQNALSLASLRFDDYNAALTVNGDCRFDHEDATYRYEDDLSPKIVELLRKGEIELDNNNWFEMFYDNGESYYVWEGYDRLPSPQYVKMELVKEIMSMMEEYEDKEGMKLFQGFGFEHLTFRNECPLTEESFRRKMEAIYTTEDLFDSVNIFDAEFVHDNYGNTHYSLFYYTQSETARSFIQEEFKKIITS